MKEEIAKQLLAKVKNDYNKIARGFSQSRAKLWPELYALKKYVKPGFVILDLGCGNGRLYELFKNLSISYTGVDISAELIVEAKKRWQGYPVNFLTADTLDLPLPEGKFDVVFMIATLQHIPSEKYRLRALAQIKRVLKKNGLFIMLNWNLFQPRYARLVVKYTILKFFGKSELDFKDVYVLWKNKGVARYYHAFSKKELLNLTKRAGFELVKNCYIKRSESAKPTNIWQGVNILTIAKKK